jgi:16S rRNA (uracil1498-N3)-methyltransferase
MSHPRLFVLRSVKPGERVELDREESKHARVRRIAAGELVEVLDGTGWSALATYEPTTRNAAAVRVTEILPVNHRESPLDLTLAIGVLKSDRFDWVIEKTTELGVTAIQPFESTHSLAHPSAARQQRWQQIALSAVKQCGRTVPPTIRPPVAWAEILAAQTPLRFLCSEHGQAEPLTQLARQSQQPPAVSIVVGPEGGFHPGEIESALAAGYRTVTLGERILRAETAAIAAVALCEELLGGR